MAMQDISELGTILSIWAHPDDEAYLCGGIMATASDAGSRVVCVTATGGELGVTDPVGWPPERLAAIGEAELAECLRIPGVDQHCWLGYPDGGCARVDRAEAVGRVADLLREEQPDTVLTFVRDGQTGHPDHIAVHNWTVDAVRQTRIGSLQVSVNTQDWLDEHTSRFLELGVIGEPPVAWLDPLSIDLDLEPMILDRKLAALAVQPSYTEAFSCGRRG